MPRLKNSCAVCRLQFLNGSSGNEEAAADESQRGLRFFVFMKSRIMNLRWFTANKVIENMMS